MAEKRIILVDDDRDTRSVLRTILERLHVDVDEASDGFEAIQQARRRRPDLIVMDIRMPGMDGVEACRALRTDADLKEIPILVLSGAMRRAKLDEISRLDDIALYDEYVEKPFQYTTVVELVKKRLGLGPGRARGNGA